MFPSLLRGWEAVGRGVLGCSTSSLGGVNKESSEASSASKSSGEGGTYGKRFAVVSAKLGSLTYRQIGPRASHHRHMATERDLRYTFFAAVGATQISGKSLQPVFGNGIRACSRAHFGPYPQILFYVVARMVIFKSRNQLQKATRRKVTMLL